MTEETKIKIEPDFNRALAVWKDDKPLEAIEILQELNNKKPEQPAIIGMIAGIYHVLEDWNQCLFYSKKAVELLPTSETFSVMLFHSLWSNKRFDEAFEEAKRFVKLNGFSQEYDLILKETQINNQTK